LAGQVLVAKEPAACFSSSQPVASQPPASQPAGRHVIGKSVNRGNLQGKGADAGAIPGKLRHGRLGEGCEVCLRDTLHVELDGRKAANILTCSLRPSPSCPAKGPMGRWCHDGGKQSIPLPSAFAAPVPPRSPSTPDNWWGLSAGEQLSSKARRVPSTRACQPTTAAWYQLEPQLLQRKLHVLVPPAGILHLRLSRNAEWWLPWGVEKSWRTGGMFATASEWRFGRIASGSSDKRTPDRQE